MGSGRPPHHGPHPHPKPGAWREEGGEGSERSALYVVTAQGAWYLYGVDVAVRRCVLLDERRLLD